MKLFELNKDYHIYCDLDGVLSDLNKHVVAITGKTFAQLRSDGNGFSHFVKSERKQGHSVFDQLDPMPDAHVLWNYIKKYNPDILTATGYPEAPAVAEKIRWVHDNLDGFGDIYTVVSGNKKAEFAAPNHILIDDRPHSIDPWREAGGIGIQHTSAADTIAQLKELGL